MIQTFESTLVHFCAPTLAGLKPAGLFQYRGPLSQTRHKVRLWDRRLAPAGLRVRILKRCPEQNTCLVYVYRPLALSRRLSGTGTRAMLRQLGYPSSELEPMLARLSRRLCLSADFPHEIGLFLGYPLADVVGFMEHQGKNCTFSGCWKSYSDPKPAQRYFGLLKKCTEDLCRSYACGASLTQLAV